MFDFPELISSQVWFLGTKLCVEYFKAFYFRELERKCVEAAESKSS